jgi:hypothetical protein
MKLRSLLLSTAPGLLLAGLVAAYEHQSSPYAGSAQFERMKRLSGTWEGTSDMARPGEKVRVEYSLTAGDSAVIEKLFPGSRDEMVSVYTDRGGKLAMTHYCMLHNQPRMILTRADGKTLELTFAPTGNDINPEKEKHMHGVRISFTDSNHIVQKWVLYDNGKASGGVTLQLARVKK